MDRNPNRYPGEPFNYPGEPITVPTPQAPPVEELFDLNKSALSSFDDEIEHLEARLTQCRVGRAMAFAALEAHKRAVNGPENAPEPPSDLRPTPDGGWR
jgi:hypothetical protein